MNAIFVRNSIRASFLLAVLALLGYGIFREVHHVSSLVPPKNKGDAPKIEAMNGPKYTQLTASDGLMLRGGRLYDANSLAPETLNKGDCKT